MRELFIVLYRDMATCDGLNALTKENGNIRLFHSWSRADKARKELNCLYSEVVRLSVPENLMGPIVLE